MKQKKQKFHVYFSKIQKWRDTPKMLGFWRKSVYIMILCYSVKSPIRFGLFWVEVWPFKDWAREKGDYVKWVNLVSAFKENQIFTHFASLLMDCSW